MVNGWGRGGGEILKDSLSLAKLLDRDIANDLPYSKTALNLKCYGSNTHQKFYKCKTNGG